MSAQPAAGRIELWEALAALRPKLLVIALQRTASREDAEDALHHVFIKIATRKHINLATLDGYAVNALTNRCYDSYRDSAVDLRKVLRLAKLTADRVPSFEEDVCDVAEAVYLREQVHELSAREQEIVLRVVDGERLVDIAADIGMNYQAAHKSLQRSRHWLSSTLIAIAGLLVEALRHLPTPRRPRAATVAPVAMVGVVIALAPFVGGSVKPLAVTPSPKPHSTTGSVNRFNRTPVRPARDHTSHFIKPGDDGAQREWTTALLRTPSVGKRSDSVYVGPSRLDYVDDNETMLQTVQRCIDKGVALTVQPIAMYCKH